MSKLVEIKTQATEQSVEDYLNNIANDQQRADSLWLRNTMQRLSCEEPKIWGSSIVGFGVKRYKSPRTGREVDWFKIGFTPRKADLSLHLVVDLQSNSEILSKLGKHKNGVGCLYIKRLSDVDLSVLEELIDLALKNK